MNCKNKLILIHEFQISIDSARNHAPEERYLKLSEILDRINLISQQLPKGSIFKNVIDFISTDLYFELGEIVEKHFCKMPDIGYAKSANSEAMLNG